MLDFAASWCTPCYRTLPRLQALAREAPDIRVVVVSVDETQAGRDRLVRELDLQLEVVWDGDHRLVSRMAPENFPATYVLDRKGAVIHSHFGYDADVDQHGDGRQRLPPRQAALGATRDTSTFRGGSSLRRVRGTRTRPSARSCGRTEDQRRLNVLPLGLIALLWPAAVPAQPPTDDETDVELYAAACAACHGDDGRGRLQAEVGFAVPLPDFTDCSFASREPDADWFAVIHEGGPVRGFDRMMPVFGDALGGSEIDAILRHVRTFCVNASWPKGRVQPAAAPDHREGLSRGRNRGHLNCRRRRRQGRKPRSSSSTKRGSDREAWSRSPCL